MRCFASPCVIGLDPGRGAHPRRYMGDPVGQHPDPRPAARYISRRGDGGLPVLWAQHCAFDPIGGAVPARGLAASLPTGRSAGEPAAVSTCRGPAAGCRHKWWVRGWEMCRSYQNCASRRDWHGHGSQAAQSAAAQPILVVPPGVDCSTGRCAAGWLGRRVTAVTSMSALLPSRSGRTCWSFFPADRLQTLPCEPGHRELTCDPPAGTRKIARPDRGRSGRPG